MMMINYRKVIVQILLTEHIVEYVWTQNFMFGLEYDDDDDEDGEESEDDGEIFADISDWTKISFQELINHSLFCTR